MASVASIPKRCLKFEFTIRQWTRYPHNAPLKSCCIKELFSKERNEILAIKHSYVTVTLQLLEKVTRYVTVTAKLELVLE